MDKTDREVMQQALEALETVRMQNMDRLIHPAKEALRARLAVPETCKADLQVAARPLTDEEIDAMWRVACEKHSRGTTGELVRNFARAIERAHGITGGNDE